MALSMTASFLPTDAAIAQPSPAASPSAQDTTPLPPVDSAKAEAKKVGRQVEIPSLHTEASTTYANSDGKTLATEFYTNPIRFKQGDAWQSVDTTLVADNGIIKPRATKAGFTLSPGGGTDLLTTASQRDGSTIKISAPQKLPAPKLLGNRAEYANAYGTGIDLVITATPTGFRQEAVIRQRPVSPLKLPVAIQLPAGLAFGETSSGKLALHDNAAKTKGGRTTEIPAPLLVDASADLSMGEEGQVGKVTTAVEKTATGQTLMYKPDAHFLADPDVTYPVTLVVADDTVWTQLPNANDTFINNSSYQNGYANSGAYHLQAGMTNSGTVRWRTYIRFEDIPEDSPLRGGQVKNADLVLWNIDSNDCGLPVGSGITARRITQRWDVSTLTWSNQPTVTSEGADTEYGAYKPTCTRGYMDYEHDLIHFVNPIAQAWADGQPNYGFQLTSGNESENTNWRAYRSKEYGEDGNGSHGPKLIIGYEPAQTRIATLWGLSADASDAQISAAIDQATGTAEAPPPMMTPAQARAATSATEGYTETISEKMFIPDGMTPEELATALDPDASPGMPPEDAIPPTVTQTEPARSQTDVAVNSSIKASFSEPVRAADVTLKDPQGNLVTGVLDMEPGDERVVFTPAQSLAVSTVYTATVSNAVDASDNVMAAYSWSFTTAGPDTTPPAVTETSPSSNAINVPVNTTLSVTFNEPVSGTEVKVSDPAGASVAGALAPDATRKIWTFKPAVSLPAETVFTIEVTAAKDDSGNSMASYTWSFTTAQPDTTAPTVTLTSPLNNATGVELGAPIQATFSEPVSDAKLTLKDGTGAPVNGTVDMMSPSIVRFTPEQPLPGEKQYVAEVSSAKDAAGNVMATYSWSFTTKAEDPPPGSPAVSLAYVAPTSDADGKVTSKLTPTFYARHTDPEGRAATFTVEVEH
ncbi:Ig-like domain-containing protein, partial [Nonomuraea sp. KM90]|uniref:Ig-like domain-containing protein n=1 Tax=Nonomuraea sp. KM90 TaxID=3457428 RepID=UPI003FCC9BEA